MSSEELSVSVNDVKLKGSTLEGEGTVPLVWAHCMGGSRESEDKEGFFAWSLDSVQSLTRFDCRGHGSSGCGADPQEHTFESLGNDLVQIVRATFEDDTPVILGGASMGSVAALHAAVALGQRVKGLVLCILPACYEIREQKRAFMHALSDSIMGNEEGYRKYLAMTRAARPIKLFADAGKARVWEPPAFTGSEAAALVLKGAALSDFPSRSTLRALQTPVIILAWDDDSMHPLAASAELASLLPNNTLHVAKTFADLQQWPTVVSDFITSVAPPRPREEPTEQMGELNETLLDGRKNKTGSMAPCCCCTVS
ncbi:hypothetical protein DIPPA_01868 [Diplonema papillatum]|nr:hypothetical protein DIPPA_01868 [Diplonema papillatum]|eukprot:gene12965-19997_t